VYERERETIRQVGRRGCTPASILFIILFIGISLDLFWKRRNKRSNACKHMKEGRKAWPAPSAAAAPVLPLSFFFIALLYYSLPPSHRLTFTVSQSKTQHRSKEQVREVKDEETSKVSILTKAQTPR